METHEVADIAMATKTMPALVAKGRLSTRLIADGTPQDIRPPAALNKAYGWLSGGSVDRGTLPKVNWNATKPDRQQRLGPSLQLEIRQTKTESEARAGQWCEQAIGNVPPNDMAHGHHSKIFIDCNSGHPLDDEPSTSLLAEIVKVCRHVRTLSRRPHIVLHV